ncbi:MAG: single-stranded DNA-binding protein [Elusimicrobia bacterium]|nr:single-stranded DNA-binding protein [Elusimicrobiota bacterium]
MEPLRVARALSETLAALRFKPPVACVYNPLEYAWDAHRQYVERWGSGRRDVLLVGMNPGPWGMAQTGVPFGEVSLVRDWIGVTAAVNKPKREHPKRPVQGLACPRREVSGARLWGWARDSFRTPERFFEKFFVINYCPLMFMEESGRNLTPDKLPAGERAPLESACDRALRELASYYKPRMIIGVGNFAADRAREALSGVDVGIHSLLHPSPANPQANKGWAAAADRTFRTLGVVAN